MSYQKELKRWQEEVSSEMTNLSKSQSKVLALYSYGMALTQRCGLNTIIAFLSLLLGLSVVNLRQQLREFLYESRQKRGKKRQEVLVTACFAPLLRWILRSWQDERVVLAMDATYLKDRFIVLAISVLVDGCAIPIAWHVRRADARGEWNPIWYELFEQIAPILSGYEVYMLADSGLRSKAVFERVKARGWHNVMRIYPQGNYRLRGTDQWRPLKELARRGMSPKVIQVDCYKGDPISCTLIVMWASASDKPCLLITDLAPKLIRHHVYRLRMWIECGFKDLKRGGLRWEQSKIQCPRRMERLLLVMAVCTFYLLRQANHVTTLPELFHKTVRLSRFTYGWLFSLVSTIRQQSLAPSLFAPYQLPAMPP